jgi:hypothetical protein
MTTIKSTFGQGGANLTPGKSAGDPNLATTLQEIADDLANLLASAGGEQNSAGRVFHGGLVTDPTTASTQLTGAGGVTEWRVNVSAAEAVVGGVEQVVAASADEVIHDTTNLLDAVGKACYAVVVLDKNGGTVSIASVKGTAAVAASAVVPTDAEITTAIGHANWIKLARCYIERDGDTSVTQSQLNAGYGQPVAALTALKTINGG